MLKILIIALIALLPAHVFAAEPSCENSEYGCGTGPTAALLLFMEAHGTTPEDIEAVKQSPVALIAVLEGILSEARKSSVEQPEDAFNDETFVCAGDGEQHKFPEGTPLCE